MIAPPLLLQVESNPAEGFASFSVSQADLLSVAPSIVLVAAGSAVLLLDMLRGRWEAARSPALTTTLYFVSLLGAVTAGAFACLSLQRGTSGTFFAGAIRQDAFTDAVGLILLGGVILSLVTAMDYLRRYDMEHGEFHCLVLYGAAGMWLFVQSANLITLFLSLETLSMAVYVLTAFARDQRRSVEGALKYFVLGGFSSGFLLFGFALLYLATGQVELEAIAAALAGGGGADTTLLLLGTALSLVGLGFKVGAVPFHTWVPDAYEGAPAVVTGFMAATVKTAAFAVLLKFVYVVGFGEGAEAFRDVLTSGLAVLAVLAMVVGNAVALIQSSVKRMLAYSAIAHTGYLLVGVTAAIGGPPGSGSTPAAGASVLFYLLPYTFMTVAGFALLGLDGAPGEDREHFGDFRGLARRRPGIALALLVILASFAGIPPLAGFWAKFFVFRDAVLAGYWELALVGVLTSVVSLYYYLRLVVNAYMEAPLETPPEATARPGPLAVGLVIGVTALAVTLLGLVPEHGYDLFSATVGTLIPGAR